MKITVITKREINKNELQEYCNYLAQFGIPISVRQDLLNLHHAIYVTEDAKTEYFVEE